MRRAVRHVRRRHRASRGFFANLAATSGRTGALADELTEAAAAADAAYAELGRFLREELREHAPAKDAVGRDVYALASRDFLGAAVDLEETYAWGWEEFLGLEAELKEVCGRITPGATPREVADLLDNDPRYQVTGTDGLQRWMQDLSDGAVAELGRTHFDIPEPIRTLDCKIAPPGGGVGAYYTGPSDDFSRPGAMWWSVEEGRETFSTWREVTTVYHEGVPGHHLQIATAVYERESLNDFQRLLAGTSGHAEGWALYAERLVRELGYLDDDGDLLGMLDAQLFRAARVVVDIGMHLELEIPGGTGFHEGERWTPELGLEFMLTRTITDPDGAAPTRSTATSAGPARRRATRSASASGCRAATPPGPATATASIPRRSTPRRCSSAAWASTRCWASSRRSDDARPARAEGRCAGAIMGPTPRPQGGPRQ